ncbi:hypothetical protein SAMN05192553_102648, partial [Cyclobacterium xiamenense]
ENPKGQGSTITVEVFETSMVFFVYVPRKDLRGWGNPKGQDSTITVEVFETSMVFFVYVLRRDLQGWGNPKGQDSTITVEVFETSMVFLCTFQGETFGVGETPKVRVLR